ncbi:MAG: type II secretion system protein [bacterium]
MKRAFSLLEVMVATAILAGTMIAVSRIVSASYLYNQKVRKIYLGTELAWKKLHDVQLWIDENGVPSDKITEEGDFDEAAYEGFRWEWSIVKVFLPLPDVSTSDQDGGYMEESASMLMGAKGMIEDFFEARIRKLTLKVMWDGGERASENVEFTIFLPADGQMEKFQQAPSGPPGAGGKTPSAPSQQKNPFQKDGANRPSLQNTNQKFNPFDTTGK